MVKRKITYILEMADRRAKRDEIGESGLLQAIYGVPLTF